MTQKLLALIFALICLPGSYAVWADETASNDKFSGIWEKVADEDDDYFTTVMALNIGKGTFEETRTPKGGLGIFDMNYSYGRLKNIQVNGQEAQMEFVNNSPIRLTLRPGIDGGMAVYFGRHLTPEQEQAEGLDLSYYINFERPEPKAAGLSPIDLSNLATALDGDWATGEEEFGEVWVMTIDQAKGRWEQKSNYGVLRADFKIVETSPDRLFVDLPDSTTVSTLVLRPDGQLEVSSGGSYVEIFRRLDPQSYQLAGNKQRKSERLNPSQQAQSALQQLALAEVACQFDDTDPISCLKPGGLSERALLDDLTVYGYRPDPEIGLAILYPEEAGQIKPEAFILLAAHNSVGAQVYCYDAGAQTGVVKLTDPQDLPVTLEGKLNIYSYDGSAPKGSQISAPRPGLTYDPNTGLVTATAP